MNVLVINQFADNKGDRAVLAVILDQLADCAGVERVSVATSRLEAWSADDFKYSNLDVQLVPWGWSVRSRNQLVRRLKQRLMRQVAYPLARKALASSGFAVFFKPVLGCLCNRRFLKAVQTADTIISTGGHHFTNWFSKNGVSPLFFDLAMAEIFGKRVVLWSQTIGGLAFSNRTNEHFIKQLMQKADSIYIRDEGSLLELENAGVQDSRIHRTHETVFGAQPGEWVLPSERQSLVGISIYTGPQRDAISANTYTKALSGLVDHITAKDYRVLFIPMQLKGQTGDDRNIIQNIIEQSKRSEQIEVLENDIPTREHMQQVQDCRLFIGHKVHSIIFSLVTGTPVLAISYHQKTNDFMSHYGLSDHCINEQDLSVEKLNEMFDKIERNLDETGETEWRQARIQQAELTEDFRRMVLK